MSMLRHIRTVTSILASVGLSSAQVGFGTKHVKVLIEGPLGRKTIFTSASPSDHRTMLNFKSEARRVGRQLGAIA